MATVKLDMRDPETKTIVEGWSDNTEYTIRTGAGPSRALATVIEAPEEPDTDDMDEPTEAAPAASPGAAAVKKGMAATY